jgi:ribA/ribD-fused uncharacterized protein
LQQSKGEIMAKHAELHRWDDHLTAIRFYSTHEGPHSCYSNFYPAIFELDGLAWPTVEHYFQAQKFHDSLYAERIRLARTPKDAKTLGRSRAVPLRPDWEQVKDDIMRRAVRRKFETHADLRAVLLGTGDAILIEDAPNDYYWGCGRAGTGKNMLGRILMEVRAALRAS